MCAGIDDIDCACVSSACRAGAPFCVPLRATKRRGTVRISEARRTLFLSLGTLSMKATNRGRQVVRAECAGGTIDSRAARLAFLSKRRCTNAAYATSPVHRRHRANETGSAVIVDPTPLADT